MIEYYPVHSKGSGQCGWYDPLWWVDCYVFCWNHAARQDWCCWAITA